MMPWLTDDVSMTVLLTLLNLLRRICLQSDMPADYRQMLWVLSVCALTCMVLIFVCYILQTLVSPFLFPGCEFQSGTNYTGLQ